MTRDREIKVPDHSPRKVGVVESDRRDKSRKVAINFLVRHPKYGKYVRRRTVLHVHDENNESRVGDRVEVAECRPVSKTKSWIVTRIIERAPDELVTHRTTVETAEGEEIGAEVTRIEAPEDEAAETAEGSRP